LFTFYQDLSGPQPDLYPVAIFSGTEIIILSSLVPGRIRFFFIFIWFIYCLTGSEWATARSLLRRYLHRHQGLRHQGGGALYPRAGNHPKRCLIPSFFFFFLTFYQDLSGPQPDLYPVAIFSGTKAVVLSTLVPGLGGKNPFLGLTYIIVGSVCIVLALAFAVKCGIINTGHFFGLTRSYNSYHNSRAQVET